jgi:putative endonuclease
MIDITTKIWIFYLLECGDKTLYCGITNNIENRLKQHMGELPGGAKYTRSRKPLKVVYQEEVNSRSEALKRELIIKKMSRRTKLNLVTNYKKINSEVDSSH